MKFATVAERQLAVSPCLQSLRYAKLTSLVYLAYYKPHQSTSSSGPEIKLMCVPQHLRGKYFTSYPMTFF